MKETWILAQAETGEADSSIGDRAVSEGAEYESTTKKDGSPDANGVPEGRRPPGGLFNSPFLLIGLMFIVMYFLLFRGPRKKQQQHTQMVRSLEKNDRIRTIGGIIGTVVEVKDDEITLKIDESNNTKIRIAPSAIGKNLSKDEK